MTMELIDKNKLDSFKYRSASERMDLPVDYMVGWNDAVDGIMCNAPTVEAIPIEWIEQYGRENWYDFGTQYNAITEMLKAWRKKNERN